MTTLPDTRAHIEFLDAQFEDFQQMQRLGRRQRECLLRDDLKGLNQAMTQIQDLMVQIRVRQRDLGGAISDEARREPDVAQRLERLCKLIESISQVRSQSEQAANGLLTQTRQEMEKSNLQIRAKRKYGHPAQVNEPRFTDGLR